MIDEFVEKYSRLLHEDDVVNLFSRLESIVGNRKEAADLCGITRTAVYNWKNLIQPMKADTKEKVLEHLLEYLPSETLEYLTDKTFESSSEVLLSYLKFLYESAFNDGDTKKFIEFATKFQDTRRKYAGMIHKKFDYEVEDLTFQLAKHATHLGSSWRPKFFRVYDSEQLDDIVPALIDSLMTDKKTSDQNEIAIRLGISPYLVAHTEQALSKGLAYVVISPEVNPSDYIPRKFVRRISTPFEGSPFLLPQEQTGAAATIPLIENKG